MAEDATNEAEAATPEVAAAGNDPDSRKRAAKHALAAALATGDTEAADAAQKELDAVNEELAERDTDRDAERTPEEAAQARKAAAGGTSGRTQAPQGRTATQGKTKAAAAE